MAQKAYKITIVGVVQGVWYRKYAKKYADSLGIKGSVQNLPNRSVEVLALLGKEREEFVTLLKRGSPLSVVDTVEVEEVALFKADKFIIK